MTRFFMTIPEAVQLVLQAGGLTGGGELFVLNMGEPVRIVDLAEDLIRLSGLTPDEIPIVYTGLRPGEKLDEALWEEGSTVSPTENPDVLRVQELRPLRGEALREAVGRLTSAARDGAAGEVVSLLAELLPTLSNTTSVGEDVNGRLATERQSPRT